MLSPETWRSVTAEDRVRDHKKSGVCAGKSETCRASAWQSQPQPCVCGWKLCERQLAWGQSASPDTVYSQNHIVLVKPFCCLNQRSLSKTATMEY
jgi:hypothetical protein